MPLDPSFPRLLRTLSQHRREVEQLRDKAQEIVTQSEALIDEADQLLARRVGDPADRKPPVD